MLTLSLTTYGQQLISSQNKIKLDGFCLYSGTSVTSSTENISSLGSNVFEEQNASGCVYEDKKIQVKFVDTGTTTYTAKSIVFYSIISNVKKAICFYKVSDSSSFIIKKQYSSDIFDLFLAFNASAITCPLSFATIAVVQRMSDESGVDGYLRFNNSNIRMGNDSFNSVYSVDSVQDLLTDYATNTSLNDYVKLSTSQTISGAKTFTATTNYFTKNITLGNSSGSTSISPGYSGNTTYSVDFGSSNRKFRYGNFVWFNSDNVSVSSWIYTKNFESESAYSEKFVVEYYNSDEGDYEALFAIVSEEYSDDMSGYYKILHAYLTDSNETFVFGETYNFDQDDYPLNGFLELKNNSIHIGGLDNSTSGGRTDYHVGYELCTVDFDDCTVNFVNTDVYFDTSVYIDNVNILNKFAGNITTANYSGSDTASIPSSPAYNNTPTMLKLKNANGTAIQYVGLGGIIINTLRGFSCIGYGSAVSNLTRSTSSGGVGSVRLLRLYRAANSSAISSGAVLGTSSSLVGISLISSSSSGTASLPSSTGSVSGTWITLSYIPSQGSSAGYAVIIAVRTA